MQELRDPDTGIGVYVWVEMMHDCAMYRFSTDAKPQKVPDDFTEGLWRGQQTNALNLVAHTLLRNFATLRPYEVSKFALMR